MFVLNRPNLLETIISIFSLYLSNTKKAYYQNLNQWKIRGHNSGLFI